METAMKQKWPCVSIGGRRKLRRAHPSPLAHAEGWNKNGRLKTGGRMLFGNMLQIVPVPN